MLEPAPIPRFFLYGEAPRDAGERFMHVETIADRSRPHDWRIRPHAHRDLHQLLVIGAGGGLMQAEMQHHAFQAPALLVIPAGVVHGFAFEPDTGGFVVTLAQTLLHEVAREEPRLRALFSTPRCASLQADAASLEEFAETLPKLKRELVWSAPASAVAAAARLTTLLVSAVRALPQPAFSGSAAGNTRAALVARLREKIELHLREGLSIAQYAAMLSVTPARLRAACVEVTGRSPARLLDERRFLEAKRDLTYTQLSIAGIAYDLQFSDPAYFSRFFRKLAGESPASFRKRTS